MQVLVIPDVHGRKFWRQTVEDNIGKVDKVVFLGDYIDPYPNEIDENSDLMECESFDDSYNLLNMLNDIVSLKKNEPEKYVLLTGNHTDSYIWSKFAAATRTDYDHWEQYHKFFMENLDCFQLVYVQGDVIFSHAGISEGWAQRVWDRLEYPNDELSSVMEIAVMLQDTPLKEFTKDYIQLISEISHYRLGDYFYGSCEWADLREHVDLDKSISQIVPKGESGIYQVFGHTKMQTPIITDKWACLDCRKGFIIDTNTFKINECNNNI